MRIHFCGADRTVTGSSHMIECNGLRVLLDMGMFQGLREEARRFNAWLADGATLADAVILSHGHLDHCGKLPVLVNGGFKGPIYCTGATAEVARIVLEDAAEIQEEDVRYLNKQSISASEPLYRRADIPDVLKQLRRVGYGQKSEIKSPRGGSIAFTLFDAGHILGSTFVLLEYDEGRGPKRLLFTADVGRYNTPIIKDPQLVPGVMDYVITESTYGNTQHAPMEQVEPQFLAAVQSCIQLRSRLLVPSFAVGRTQTVLFYMQKFIHEGKIPSLPIYVDSPMGVEVSRVYSEFRDNYDDQTNALINRSDLFGLSRVAFTSSVEQSKQINSTVGPCVIIASSPTCEFGRILHHLKLSVERPNDLVIFVGWTPPNTLGRRLQDGQRRARIHDRWYDVKCRTQTIHGLSAHADGDELIRFLTPTLNKQTRAFVVHGEADVAEAFAQKLLNKGMGSASVPALDTSSVESYAIARYAEFRGNCRIHIQDRRSRLNTNC